MSDPVRRIVATLGRWCGADIALVAARSRGWASITFTGAQHRLDLRLTGAGAARALGRLQDGIGDIDFDLSGHLVADITLVECHDDGTDIALVVEVLTVED